MKIIFWKSVQSSNWFRSLKEYFDKKEVNFADAFPADLDLSTKKGCSNGIFYVFHTLY